MKRLIRLTVLLTPALAIAPRLSAGVIYNDMSPAFTGFFSQYYFNGGNLATTFTTTGGGILSTIDFEAATHFSPTVSAALYTNSGAGPGTLLESWTVDLPEFIFTSTMPLTTVTSVLHPSLDVGAQYWFVLTPAPGARLIWDVTDEAVTGGVWTVSDTNINDATQAFAIDLTPAIRLTSVPEPGSAVLATLGGFALLLRKKILRPSPDRARGSDTYKRF